MLKVPLYIVTGAGGSGKTFVINELRKLMPGYIILDYDGIHRYLKDDSRKVDKYQVQNIWLRMIRDIAESGHTIILSGLIKPEDIQTSPEFRYFPQINYLILHCDENTREKRLRERKRMNSKKIKYIKKLAQWFIELADQSVPPIPIIDTSNVDVTEVSEQIREWILEQEKVFYKEK